MAYQLKQYPQVKKQLRQLPKRIQKDVAQAILDVQFDPYPPIAELLREQYANIYKIKIDGWRIFYDADEQDKVVTIIAIKRRNKDTSRRIR